MVYMCEIVRRLLYPTDYYILMLYKRIGQFYSFSKLDDADMSQEEATERIANQCSQEEDKPQW